MKSSVYLFHGGTLARQQNTLRYSSEDKRPRFFPVVSTQDIHLFGEATLNTSALNFLSQRNIPLHVYNYYGSYSGSYLPRESSANGILTLQQANCYNDVNFRLNLAKQIINGALINIKKVAQYYARRGVNTEAALKKLIDIDKALEKVNSIEGLMAKEGNTREAYYSVWDNILKDKSFPFERRSRRPPKNPLNALISFGNTMLYTTCLTEIFSTHLDPRIGYLHATNERNFSLHLDISELFKPIIVDRVIFTLINKKMLNLSHFKEQNGGTYLNSEGRKIFLRNFDERLKKSIRLVGEHKSVSYRTVIRKECYKIEKYLTKNKPYEPFVAEW